MKQLFKISLLLIVLFLTVPIFAEGDMGAGGRPDISSKAPESTGNTKNLDSSNDQKDAQGNLFSWIYQQVLEFID